MQMYAFYNDDSGLYLATHDACQNVKEFGMGPHKKLGESPVLSITHFFPEAGNEVSTEYDTVVGVFHGDWHDAADIYKLWARKQWWCRRKLRERDIPDWMRSAFAVFQMSNYDIPELKLNHSLAQIAETVNALSQEAGIPLLALIFNWEGGGAWTGPRGFFPPREGEDAFREAMLKLRQARNHGFVYITGGMWYIRIPHEPPFDSWEEFRAEALPHAVKNPDGEIRLSIWESYGGWESGRLCPQRNYTLELTAEILIRCLELGSTVVQIDNLPCGGSEACYDPSHGHPPGNGSWWSEAWGRILAELRKRAKAKNPQSAITTEGISENFIPYLDMYDHRGGNMEYFGHYSRGLPMGGEVIPLFNYVYNEYIGSYCAAYPESNRPEVLYWTRCLGKSLVHGVVPTGGRYFPTPAEHNPITITFFKKVARALKECWKYVMFGEMLKPPLVDVPGITAPYCKFHYDGTNHLADPKQRHEVRDKAVQHSVWRAQDGTIGYLFVNICEEEVKFEVELSPCAPEARHYELTTIRNGVSKDKRVITLPCKEQVEMEPLSIVLIEIRAEEEK